jgi:cohesin loading factor subunit SCC2
MVAEGVSFPIQYRTRTLSQRSKANQPNGSHSKGTQSGSRSKANQPNGTSGRRSSGMADKKASPLQQQLLPRTVIKREHPEVKSEPLSTPPMDKTPVSGPLKKSTVPARPGKAIGVFVPPVDKTKPAVASGVYIALPPADKAVVPAPVNRTAVPASGVFVSIPQVDKAPAPAGKATAPTSGVFVSLPQLSTDDQTKFPAASLDDFSDDMDLDRPEIRKAKRGHEDSYGYQDQRLRAEGVLDGLNQTLSDVLDAANAYAANPDSEEVAEFFSQSNLIADDEPVFLQATLIKLEGAISRASSLSVFGKVELDPILRLQKLLEANIRLASKLSLSISPDASDADVEEWSRSLELVNVSLLALRVLLRTMTAGREEKQLYSEDILDSAIACFSHVVEICIIPVIETRTSTPGSAFAVYSRHKNLLLEVLQESGRALRLLGALVVQVDFAESAVTRVETLSNNLIFIENAHSEKEAILGIQRFETFRRAAMDTLAKIFAKQQNRRASIVDDILMSLEKLPSTRQSARQYKLLERKPIQLVSALLMRLVQSCALWINKGSARRGKQKASSEDEGSEESDHESDDGAPIDMDEAPNYSREDAAAELRCMSEPLMESAKDTASRIVRMLISRALTSTKSGDQPYRTLLDIFTEDFLNVLGLPEWPAAELLLRVMLSALVPMMDDDKRSVPQKNMALDLMTVMSSAISELQNHIQNSMRLLEPMESSTGELLRHMTESYLSHGIAVGDLVSAMGPYRLVFEWLHRKQGDAQVDSARGLLLVAWATSSLGVVDRNDEDSLSVTPETLLKLRNTVSDHNWLSSEYESPSVDATVVKVAANIITASSQFCRYHKLMIEQLLKAMNSSHAQLTSKSLKNVPQLLEKDPSILEKYNTTVMTNIIKCSENPSPLVRQSALSLMEKCMILKPAIELAAYFRVILLSGDEHLGVRKRALKALKDLYFRNSNEELRLRAAVAMLKRVKDHEPSAAEISQQSLEELWLDPYHEPKTSHNAVQTRVALQDQTVLIVKVLDQGSTQRIYDAVRTFLQTALSDESKSSALNFKVCKDMVSFIMEAIIDNTSKSGTRQHHFAKALTVFAKANPRLFSSGELEVLQPYVKTLVGEDAMLMFRATVVVYRHVLPSLSSVQHKFLQEVHHDILNCVTKIPATELLDAAGCLGLIRDTLDDVKLQLQFVVSILQAIRNGKVEQLNLGTDKAKQAVVRLARVINIAGPIAKNNLENMLSHLRGYFPAWKGKTVSGLFVDSMCPFTDPAAPHDVREATLRSVAMICQTWPQHYLRNDVSDAFDHVFEDENVELQHVVLEGFLNFFLQEEQRSETGAEIKVGRGAVHGQERLAKSFVASDNDGAITTIAQKFLRRVLKLALMSTDDLALAATKVIASINRQGLVHPKECGPALVALETSPNPSIASIALEAHKALHSKHESMFEKEYIKAVQQAFRYQKNIIKKPRGVTLGPTTAKLRHLFDVLKSGSVKVRKRFLGNICNLVNFELPKLDVTDTPLGPPNVVLLARFVLENLALFDYPRIDELMHLINSLEKMVVAGAGAAAAHAIETEVLKVQIQPNGEGHVNGHLDASLNGEVGDSTPAGNPDWPEVDPARLRQLAVASMISTMTWECRTQLRNVWGLQKSKTKITAKDMARAPTKQNLVGSEKFLDKVTNIMAALENPDSQLAIVKSFAELIAVDPELKVSEEDIDDELGIAQRADGYDTPSEAEGEHANPPGSKSGPGRKRKPGNANNTPNKRPRASTTPKKGPGRLRKRSIASASSAEASDGEWA